MHERQCHDIIEDGRAASAAEVGTQQPMPFRAILFDIGDTLWHSRGAPPAATFRAIAAQRAAAELRCFGIRGADPALVARTAWDSLEGAMRDARKTDLVEPDYGLVCQQALRGQGVVLTHEQACALLEATYVSGAQGGKLAYPDARPTLLALRARGFRLGMVTNRAFGGGRFRADLHEAGLDIGWDAEAVSVEVGFLKPHPALFEDALRKLGTAPGETLMVGNSLAEDIAGAQAVGMAAAWRRSTPDADGVTPDYTFDEVGELLSLPALEGSAG